MKHEVMMLGQQRELLKAVRLAQEQHYVFGNPDDAYAAIDEIEQQYRPTNAIELELSELHDRGYLDRMPVTDRGYVDPNEYAEPPRYRVNWRGLHEIGYQ